MTNPGLFTPLNLLNPFDLALSYVDSLTAAAPAFSRQAAIMAHRESLNAHLSPAPSNTVLMRLQP